MRVQLKPVEKVEKGTYFSMKTNELIRRNDKLFKIEPQTPPDKKIPDTSGQAGINGGA
jgi:putative protease